MKKLLIACVAVTALAGCAATPDASGVYTVPSSEMPTEAPSPIPFPAPAGYLEAMRVLGAYGSDYELVHDAEDACVELMSGGSTAQVTSTLADRMKVARTGAAGALPTIKEYFC